MDAFCQIVKVPPSSDMFAGIIHRCSVPPLLILTTIHTTKLHAHNVFFCPFLCFLQYVTTPNSYATFMDRPRAVRKTKQMKALRRKYRKYSKLHNFLMGLNAVHRDDQNV